MLLRERAVITMGKENERMADVEKLYAGLEYNCCDPGVVALRQGSRAVVDEYNAIPWNDTEKRIDAARKMLGGLGEDPYIVSPLYFMSGKNIKIGKNVLCNYNVVFLDVLPIEIGDYCMIAPGVVITTVTHPLSPKSRREHHAIAAPVKMGNDVWIGANATILPGVTIGNNVVVGAGAVVTKDIPDNCVVAGVPAKIIRHIEDDTKE